MMQTDHKTVMPSSYDKFISSVITQNLKSLCNQPEQQNLPHHPWELHRPRSKKLIMFSSSILSIVAAAKFSMVTPNFGANPKFQQQPVFVIANFSKGYFGCEQNSP